MKERSHEPLSRRLTLAILQKQSRIHHCANTHAGKGAHKRTRVVITLQKGLQVYRFHKNNPNMGFPPQRFSASARHAAGAAELSERRIERLLNAPPRRPGGPSVGDLSTI